MISYIYEGEENRFGMWKIYTYSQKSFNVLTGSIVNRKLLYLLLRDYLKFWICNGKLETIVYLSIVDIYQSIV